jgi:hypothetical protein
MGILLARPQRIQPFSKPSFLGPSPVTISVRVEVRRFHGDLRSTVQQSVCHQRLSQFSSRFLQISLRRPDEKRYLQANFERPSVN